MHIRRASACLAILVVFVGIGVLLTAKTSYAADAGIGQGLQISPALVTLNGDPGKTYSVTLRVTNVTSSELVYSSSIDDFKAKDESGTPGILVDDKLPVTASVRTWISVLPSFELQPHQDTSLVATIRVPANAEPGGHYGVIQFSGSVPTLSQTGVGLSASAGVLVLIRVSGDITEKASLASFSTLLNDKQSSFFEKGPIAFSTRINNAGNVHVAPIGTIEIHNMVGGLVSTIKVNSDSSNVLPESIRRFDSTYNKSWMLGRYTADLTLGYGTTGGAITGTLSFWVIPYKIVLVVLLVGATIIYVFSRLLKQYNKHIIAKSKNENSSKTKKSKKK